MTTAGFVIASVLALAGGVCAFIAGARYLDQIEDHPDESNRSFPAPLVTTFRDGERGGGGRLAWPAQSAGTASRQSFAKFHRRLRRAELRRYLKGNHIR